MDNEKEKENTAVDMTSDYKSSIKIVVKYPEKYSDVLKQMKINRIYDILSEKAE